MYEAHCGGLGGIVTADQYAALSSPERASYRDSLSCTSCEQPAYFIRRARNGRAACFGARPHLENCQLAATLTDDRGSGRLPEDEPRFNRGDELVLQSARPRAIPHVRHNPGGDPHTGVGRRYTGIGGARAARSNMGLPTLLRRLVREPDFAENRAMLVMPDDTRMSIRKMCVAVIDADTRFRDRKRIYWGTIRYVSEDDDGAWLNLGRAGAPALRLSGVFLDALMTQYGVDDVEDLQGAAFIFYGHLRQSRTSDRMFLFPDDLDWFALRLPDEDPI